MYPLPPLNADLKQYQCNSTCGLKRKYNEIRPEYVQNINKNSKKIKVNTATTTPTQKATISAAKPSFYPQPIKNKDNSLKAKTDRLPPSDVIIAAVKAYRKISLKELEKYFYALGYKMSNLAFFKKCMSLVQQKLFSKQVENSILMLSPQVQYNLNNITTMTATPFNTGATTTTTTTVGKT